MGYSTDRPWIERREATVCLWKPDYIRGFISSMNTSLLIDFMCFSDRQFEEYALMLKECGFTGVQVTDMCSAWRPSGSPEFVHDRLRVFADALHRHGMEFTLWCWAAEFGDHGWHDDDVVYTAADGGEARNDPRVRAAFEKYYDIYAEAAPFTDRVIAHYYDPGNLTSIDDVLFFLRRFADKFKAANPAIKIGVDTWGSPAEFPDRLVAAGFDDIMLMELPFLPIWREDGKRARFREGVKKLGCELGSWGWYTCEYETDQRPFMCVNNRVLSDVYRQVRAQGDSVMIPSYWSEMDAYHVLNFFSLYAAGHLLIDPDADPDMLLRESAALLAGDDDTNAFTSVLELIRDARSGDTWETYWWSEGNYILRLGDPADILARAKDAAEVLEGFIERRLDCAKCAFPLKPWQIMKLILPHIRQIESFAKFRIGYAALCDKYDSCGDTPEVRAELEQLWQPVPEYNCIIGLWGQPEALEQTKMLREFGDRTGIPIPRVGYRDFAFKRRLVDRLTAFQRQHPYEKFYIDPLFYEAGVGLGSDETRYLCDELVREGVFVRREDGCVALADSESIRFDFNI